MVKNDIRLGLAFQQILYEYLGINFVHANRNLCKAFYDRSNLALIPVKIKANKGSFKKLIDFLRTIPF